MFHVHWFQRVNMMSNSNYSIGLQRLKPVHTAYGAICMPIRKLHWHHSSTSQLCVYGDGPLHDYTVHTSSRATDI